jgi:hypothetical protein
MAADVTLNKTYKVRNSNVFLSLIIGEGQFGTSDVFVDNKRILRTSGSFGKLRLGKGSELAGKDLLVRTVVNDTVAQTNRMAVSYKLSGGSGPGDFVAKGKVGNEGDSLIFEATFSLVAAA